MSKALKIDANVIRRLLDLARDQRMDCAESLFDLPSHFGKPHVHSGLSIRKIGQNLFESRAGFSLRFVFRNEPDALRIVLLGDHNEVKAYLRHK